MKMAECNEHVEIDSNPLKLSTHQLFQRPGCIPLSPQQQSSSDLSSSVTDSSIVTTGEYLNRPTKDDQSVDDDENVWWEELSAEKQANLEYSEANAADPQLQFPSSSLVHRPHNDESMDFWLNLYMEAGEWPELPEL